jgi:hypothetical protein
MWRIGDGMEEIAAFDAGVGLYSCDSPSEERTILAGRWFSFVFCWLMVLFLQRRKLGLFV